VQSLLLSWRKHKKKIKNPRNHNCRTRFTFSRPTPENAVSILFGVRKGSSVAGEKSDVVYDSTPPKISFNHDDVGITKPIASTNPFPSCMGYPKKEKRYLRFLNQLEKATINNDTTLCSSANFNGWRILRFQARVGYGKSCYKRLQNAVFNWDFEAQEGKKSMGIVSSAAALKSSTHQRRNLLATFTEISLPSPLKSIFVVSPVHVVQEEVKDARSVPKCLFSSTSYATLSGHLLAGEERVAAVWRKGMGNEVEIEIVSFSRAAPSIGGRLIWPLIGRMQKQFFLAEVDHLVKVGHAKLCASFLKTSS